MSKNSVLKRRTFIYGGNHVLFGIAKKSQKARLKKSYKSV